MRTFFLSITTIIVFVTHSYSQCNVTVKKAEDGALIYTAQKEAVYKDERYESGILFASLQLEVKQHPTDSELLQFYLNAWVVRKGNKPLVVPRIIKVTFSDYSTLDLVADIYKDPLELQGAMVHVCVYKLNSAKYIQFLEKSISEIVITDNRSGESITCSPFSDLLKEQAKCIANRLKN